MDGEDAMVCIPTVVFLLTCTAAVTAIAPVEELYDPKLYSFGYTIKDKHGAKENGDGLHRVKDSSYAFKDNRGTERQVNYVTFKGGFRSVIKTDEPGTAPLNPAALKMELESLSHPYFRMKKEPLTNGVAKGVLASRFGFPKFSKLEESSCREALVAVLVKENSVFDFENLKKFPREGLPFLPTVPEDVSKEDEAAKEGLPFLPNVAKDDDAAKERPFPPTVMEDVTKDEAAKSLEKLSKEGFAIVPVDLEAAKEVKLGKDGLFLADVSEAADLAKFCTSLFVLIC